MSLPRFLERVHAAAGPLLGGIAYSELGDRLRQTSVVLEMSHDVARLDGQRGGYLLAANLAARLYPRLGFDAPQQLRDEAVKLARSINPKCVVGPPRGRAVTISWNGAQPTADRVTVAASGWNVELDGTTASSSPATPPAAMAGAAIAIGELFRAVFAPELAHGRTGPAPFALNLITLGGPAEVPPLPKSIKLGTVHLAGCGAIGQAAVALLRELPVIGTLIAVDYDRIDTGNLQRYILTTDADERAPKPDVIARALEGHPMRVQRVPTPWGADERTAPGRDTVLSALDTKQGRIELQAGLHCELFNAWTQPEDIGVSRHQVFGHEPCLACLAWPTGPRPSQSELIAQALEEHELRVLIYLANQIPAGKPIPAELIKPTGRLALPAEAAGWGTGSLLDDVAARFELRSSDLRSFRQLPLQRLYRDVVCAGVLLEQAGRERHREISVPLAHQSALAGILLATWLVIDRVPELRARRPDATQARYDLLRGGQQVWPRARGRYERCLCADPDFLAAYNARWEPPTGHDGGQTPR